MTPRGSVVDVYLHYNPKWEGEDGEPAEVDHEIAWADFKEDLQQVLMTRYGSFSEPAEDRWLDRECHVILENRHGCVTLSEYCGCVSVSLVPDDDYPNRHPEMSKAWCEQIEDGFRETIEKAYPAWALRRVGHMSNGESVYQHTNHEPPKSVQSATAA